MAEVRDDLVPVDGLTTTNIRFAGFEVANSGGTAVVRFEIVGGRDELVGVFTVAVGPQPEGTIDAMIADAHDQMCDVLRTWLFRMDRARSAYAQRRA